jgi:hypothetical protein
VSLGREGLDADMIHQERLQHHICQPFNLDASLAPSRDQSGGDRHTG